MPERKHLLVWGTTYPEWSSHYYETVCTGAVDGATGDLVRIYPIRLRYLETPFTHYQWIDVTVVKPAPQRDSRPESYRVDEDTIERGEAIPAGKKGWEVRAAWVLRPQNVFQSVETLLDAEHERGVSLGLVKPRELSVTARKKPETERVEWEKHKETALASRELFEKAEDRHRAARELEFIPVSYVASFRCDDDRCTGHNMSMRDWGIGILHRDQVGEKGEERGQQAVIDQIMMRWMDPERWDAYFFLGNTAARRQQFMVVGMFHRDHPPPQQPDPPQRQGELFTGL